MKLTTYSLSSLLLLSSLLFITACQREEIPQFTLELTQEDGTRENYILGTGNMLLVYDGDMRMVVKTTGVDSDEELGLEVTTYSLSRDTVNNAYTITKTGNTTQRITLTKSALLDPAGTVQVNLQSVTRIQATQNPKGKCKGNCCEAKCFSLWCCADTEECKDVPCDCKPPSGCLVTHTVIQPANYFDLYASGKDALVVKH